MFSFSVFIKLLIKAVIAWDLAARLWAEMAGSMYISILFYIIDFDRQKRRFKKWFKNLMRC